MPNDNTELNAEILKVLIQRIDHLENILVFSALSLLITTTFAIYTAIYSLKNSSNLKISSSVVLTGVSLIYFLLSGYYYFMLTHFYATTCMLLPLRSEISDIIEIELLWKSFQLTLPFLRENAKMYLALLNAPIFPLLFSSLSIVVVWNILKKEIESATRKYLILVFSISAQLMLFFSMIWYPFSKFVNVII